MSGPVSSAASSPVLPETPLPEARRPETTLSERVREWIDLLPWLRLGRVLRIAGSPPLLGVTALTGLAVWLPAVWLGVDPRWSAAASGPWPPDWTTGLIYAWAVLVAAPVVQLHARQGALLAAGRDLMDLGAALRLVGQRCLTTWMAIVIPAGLVAAAMVPLWMVGVIQSWIGGGLPWLLTVLSPLIAAILLAIALPAGLLGFGATVAVPLAIAAIGVEREADSLDSLSRGYEAFLRRPLRCVLYVVLAAVAVATVTGLAGGVAWTAAALTSGVMPTTPPHGIGGRLIALLGAFAWVVGGTLSCGMLGGIYLLLRHDTGGQEIEDIWQPATAVVTPLPKLPADIG